MEGGQTPQKLVELDVPLWDPDAEEPREVPVAFALPHLILDTLPTDKLPEYCELQENQQEVKDDLQTFCARTGLDAGAEDKPLAACSLWGDSAPYSNKDSLNLLIFTILSGIHRTTWWLVAFPKSSVCRCGCRGSHTFNRIFDILAWSFRAAAIGIHPAIDHTGKALEAGYLASQRGRMMSVRGALVAKRGDWQWMKSTLGLCGWSGEGPSRRMCWKCKACFDGSIPPFDFTSQARWRSTVCDMKTLWDGDIVSVSSIWGIPGFCLDFVKADWMHVSCLGILQAASGSAMWELFVALGGTWARPVEACARLLKMIKVMSKEADVECPIGDLTVTMFRSAMNKKPKMKLKAAEGRRFLVVLRKVLGTCFPVSDRHSSTRFSCIDNLYWCYRELEDWTDGGKSTMNLARMGRRHLLLYTALHDLVPPNSLLWRLLPKHHLFAHLITDARSNPRLSWNYTMESEIGNAAALAARVSKQHLHRVLLPRHNLTA